MTKILYTIKILFLSLLLWPVNAKAADPVTDSLKAVLNKAPHDSSRVDVLVQLSTALYGSEPNQAIQYGKEAEKISDSLGYLKGKAMALKYIGLAYNNLGNYLDAIISFQQSLEIFKTLNDQVLVSNLLNNLGAVYFNRGEDATALDYHLKSLHAAEQAGNKMRIATAKLNIGAVYSNKPATVNKAIEYYLEALPLAEEVGDNDIIGTVTVNLGEIYRDRGKTDSALYYFRISLKAYENTDGVPYTLNQIGKVYVARADYSTAIRYHQQAYESAEKVGSKLYMTQSLLGIGDTYEKEGKITDALEAYTRAMELAMGIRANYELKDAYSGMALSYAKLKDFGNAYRYQSLFTELKDTIYNLESDKKMAGLQLRFDIQKKQGEIDLLIKENALKEENVKRQKLVKNSFMAGLILILIIAFILYRGYRMKVKTNQILDQQKQQIQLLLLNILPEEVAEDLKRDGHAEPKYFDSVSVLFSDFKSFSKIADDMSPQQLVSELNECFMAFDDIVEKYGLEKIKTIGDSYMCAGGIPSPDPAHAINIIRAGMDMQAYVDKWNEKRRSLNLTPWEMRVGVHTGPLVAGVVGKKKYAYDIWGSTVNVASRMESNGEPGQINISDATYNKVRHIYTCKYRGKIYAKNVGEIDMYFVDHELTHLPTSQKAETEKTAS